MTECYQGPVFKQPIFKEPVSKKIKLPPDERLFRGCKVTDLNNEEMNEVVGNLVNNFDKWSGLPPKNPMLQLFSVSVDFKANKPAKIYGYVDIDGSGTGSGFDPLFYCEPEDSQPICNKGLVPLTDPSSYHAISASSFVEIIVELYLLIEGEDEDIPRQVCNAALTWDITNYWARSFDTCLSNVSVGEYGSATIYYIVPKRAVEATIEVSFNDDDVARGRNVRGKIVAYYGNFDFECSPDELDYYKLTLFEAESFTFLPTGKISLIRSVMAVPGKCSLIIEAHLWDDSGDEIFNALYEFPAELKDSSSDRIEGIPGCSLSLNVDWKCQPPVTCADDIL